MKKQLWTNRTGGLIALAVLVILAVPIARSDDQSSSGGRRSGVVYVVSNDPVDDGNAVLAYRNDGHGNLTPLPGSPFRTGGTGYASRHELPHFGPFDSDQNLVATPDRRRVFATNGGSDTVAVFDVADDGSLRAVEGSPFPSGGMNPVSLGLAGDKVYVVNKNEDPGRDMTKTLPNYSGFAISTNGQLDAIEGARVELGTAWRSPTQALVVRDKFIFDGDFGSFYLPSREAMWGKELRKDTASTIRSLRIEADGALVPLPPLAAPEGAFAGGLDTDKDGKPDPLMFGLQTHPKEKLVYVCFVTAAKLAVFEYDDAGRLTFLQAVPNSGELICWLVVNAAGTRAYTANNASDTLSVYDLSDARKPAEIQHLHLKGHGNPYQLALDSREKFLYTVKHRTFKETPVGDGSVLNVLEVLPTGKVREVPSSPVTLPVRDDLLARPQGVLAF